MKASRSARLVGSYLFKMVLALHRPAKEKALLTKLLTCLEGAVLLNDLKVCILFLLMHQLQIGANLPVAVSISAITRRQMHDEASLGMESCKLSMLSKLCAGYASVG